MSALLTDLPLGIAWAFAGTSLLHLVGPRWLAAMYQRWNYPRAFPYVAATLNIAVAVLLASPQYRSLGIAAAAIIAFFSAVAIIANEKLISAFPAMVLMAALVQEVVTIPQQDPFTYFAPELAALVSTR